MPKFYIEQIALAPTPGAPAEELLAAIGLTDWARDVVHARGRVFGLPAEPVAALAFNYQATRGLPAGAPAGGEAKPLEVEVLRYTDGVNWIAARTPLVSHLGMHCSVEELDEWRAFFAERGISVSQEVVTQSHTNPAIAGQRWYRYVIFDTHQIIGVDLKFIVRLPAREESV